MNDCRKCNRTFRAAADLRRHRTDSPRHNSCFRCCVKGVLIDFANIAERDHHVETRHLECVACGAEHKSKAQLDKHKEDVHDICAKCGTLFNSPN
jgi:hypothetical protein